MSSISGGCSSCSSSYYQPNLQANNPLAQLKQDANNGADPLQVGNVSDAQGAFSALQQLQQSAPPGSSSQNQAGQQSEQNGSRTGISVYV